MYAVGDLFESGTPHLPSGGWGFTLLSLPRWATDCSLSAIALSAFRKVFVYLLHFGLSLLLGCLAASFREPIPCVGVS